MTYRNTEVVDAAQDKFGFLSHDYGFAVTVREAQGTYLSQIVFRSSHLEIFIGVWGQGNELWMTFTPLISKDIPPLELEDVLNGITNDLDYFEREVRRKTEWPIFTHSFPQYFEICAFELRKHCGKILAGDLSVWIDIVRNVLNLRVERSLTMRQRSQALELTESDKMELEPLVTYIKSIYPDFSLLEIQYNILDKLTR